MDHSHFYQMYRPITAKPCFSQGRMAQNGIRQDMGEAEPGYQEWEPCDALKPYIRCFWEKRSRGTEPDGEKWLVIPDTCMDVIFQIDRGRNRIMTVFCGMDDSPFVSEYADEEKEKLSFGIRFYPWSAAFFAEESMRGTKNGFFDGEYHFSRLKKMLEPQMLELNTPQERISRAETCFIKNYHPKPFNSAVMESVFLILQKRGNIRIEELGREIHQSCRQLQRLFQEYMGISPKQFSSLVRYQYLWKWILADQNFPILDAVLELGYTDQPHLLHDFKRFHSMSVREAREYAMNR